MVKTIKRFKINWVGVATSTTRVKARHVNIGALPKVHSSHNSDFK